jgi:hypothetical protein
MCAQTRIITEPGITKSNLREKEERYAHSRTSGMGVTFFFFSKSF